MLRIVTKFPTTVVVDGEVIPIKIKRLLPEEATSFNTKFGRLGARATVKKPENETPAQQTAREMEEDAIELDGKRFVVEAMSKYVEVEPGHIFADDSTDSVTSGADFVRLFGSYDELLSEILMIIFMENRLTAEQKAAWKARLAPFVPTPPTVVARMVELAGVKSGDRFTDLGCGDGRLCVAAALAGATCTGYDIDPQRIAEARLAATAAGVQDKCTFVEGDAMEADLTKSDVVSLYLLSGSNAKLRPRLVEQLPAGARVISHSFTMNGGWTHDVREVVPPRVEVNEEGVSVDMEPLAHTGQRIIYLFNVDKYRSMRAAADKVGASAK